MSWLKDLWNGIKGAETVDMVFIPNVSGAPAQNSAFVPDKCYVELYVDSLRLRNARKFTSKFDAVVYTYVTLAFAADDSKTLPAISKPENLANLDPGGLNRVITVNKQMMGAVPWRGGRFLLELGLFSVKGDNLLTPVLDFVTEISTTAGVSFVGKVAPFAPLITKGMEMLAGQTKDVALEVGLDTAFEAPGDGTHAIIAVPKGSAFDQTKLSVDAADRKLLYDNQPLKAAYCVFSLRQTAIKADYGEIPEIKEKFAELRRAIRSRRQDEAEEAFAAFRVTVLTSSDLIRDDAMRLVQLAQQMMEDGFAGGAVSFAEGQDPPGPRTLADVPLYEDGGKG